MGERPGAPSRAGVAGTYDRIAGHFAETRSRPWPPVERFVDDHGGVDLAVDLGCGNGRHFGILQDAADRTIGIDASRSLLGIAASGSQGVDLVQADVVSLPLRTDRVDLCLYVATIHHLPTAAERARSLAELARVLGPSGRALVSAWSVGHDKFDADSGHDRWVDWTLPDGEVVPRFYHIFDLEEFTRELEGSEAVVEATFEAEGNCYGVVRGSSTVG